MHSEMLGMEWRNKIRKSYLTNVKETRKCGWGRPCDDEGRKRKQSQERKQKDKTARRRDWLSGRGAGIELATERIVYDSTPNNVLSFLQSYDVGSPSRGSLNHPSRAWVRSDVTSRFMIARRATRYFLYAKSTNNRGKAFPIGKHLWNYITK